MESTKLCKPWSVGHFVGSKHCADTSGYKCAHIPGKWLMGVTADGLIFTNNETAAQTLTSSQARQTSLWVSLWILAETYLLKMFGLIWVRKWMLLWGGLSAFSSGLNIKVCSYVNGVCMLYVCVWMLVKPFLVCKYKYAYAMYYGQIINRHCNRT